MGKYKTTIGLEVHAGLKTKTKMFCDSPNDSEERNPNVNICPVCVAHPGTLPVINKEAVKHVLKLGIAVGGQLADYTEFDRKNYFYPDIPKGYQISQYKHPLVQGGELAGVKLTRVHLEEDTARSIHSGALKLRSGAKNTDGEYSLVDFNRAGIPLMELVTEPVIKSSEEASNFARELQTLLRFLDISDANMEKGEMRVEANISISPIEADSKADNSGLLYEELSYKVRGAAFNVYNSLGSGHKETVYQNALMEEFSRLGIPYEKEKSIGVRFNDKKVGSCQPDFVVDNKIIVEIRALPFIGKVEKQQVNYYLKNTEHKLALIINFGSSPIQIERIIYDAARNPHKSTSNPPESASYLRKSAPLGTKVEVKNLNSFRAVERAIEYEIERQSKILDRSDKVRQETRGWDDAKGETFPQREKEESHDYRYFPDPDLPKLLISEIKDFSKDVLLKEIPELPWKMRKRFKESYGLKSDDIEFFISNKMLRDLFEEAVRDVEDKDKILLTANYITSDLTGLLKSDPKIYLDSHLPFELKIDPKNMSNLIEMVSSGDLSSRGAKDVLAIMYEKGGDPKQIAEEGNLMQLSDESDIEALAEMVIGKHLDIAEDFRKGNDKVLKFLVGQGMKESKGSANPQLLSEILEKKLRE